ncbi:MAG: thioredoxin domain-containing protein [Spirochaetota bacterium]
MKYTLGVLFFLPFVMACAKGKSLSSNYVTIDGKKYTVDDVEKESPAIIYKAKSQYQEAVSQAFAEFAMERIKKAEAKKKNIKPEEVLSQGFQQKEPSQAEIERVYQQYKAQFRGAPLEKVQPDIVKFLKENAKQRYEQAQLQKLRQEYKVDIQMEKLEPPRLKVAEKNNPALGPKDAKVTVIEFSDFECGFCKRSQNVNKALRKKYKGKIRWVFRDYPLPFHQNAFFAHVAANCAKKQDKFWDYFNILFQNTGSLQRDNVIRLAGNAGLDDEKFKACLKEEQTIAQEVQADINDGKRLGVNGTPAFFINGIMVEGAQPLAKFEEIIDKELKN